MNTADFQSQDIGSKCLKCSFKIKKKKRVNLAHRLFQERGIAIIIDYFKTMVKGQGLIKSIFSEFTRIKNQDLSMHYYQFDYTENRCNFVLFQQRTLYHHFI